MGTNHFLSLNVFCSVANLIEMARDLCISNLNIKYEWISNLTTHCPITKYLPQICRQINIKLKVFRRNYFQGIL